MTASMAISNTFRTINSRNVVAKLEGSDPALENQYVVYTAHWDHFGIGAAVNGDKIYNGARDNASGVAGMLEVARAFTQVRPQPKRSILFTMVTAEEQGLLGSQYYSVDPLYPLAKTVADINIDEMNVYSPSSDVTVIGMGASDLDDYLKQAAQEQGRTLHPDSQPEKGFYYRSDHFNFAKQGVPALYIESGEKATGGRPPEYLKKKLDEYRGEGLSRAVGRSETRLGPARRGAGRGTRVRRRVSRGQQCLGFQSGSRATNSRRGATRC